MRAFGGEPNAVMKLLWSNWSPDTTLTSYRPLVSFSLAGDYALWGVNAFGYHLCNLLMFGGCIAFVGLIARELCVAFEVENAVWVGVTSAVLFAAYPLHPEAVAWIIGRVDVLCGLFLFASTYCYLAHRRCGRRGFLIGAIVTFVLAMMSKEMAVTLPVVLTLFELCAPTKPVRGYVRFKFTRALLWMWATLAAFAVWRTAILGTVVGGYGGTGWKTIKQGFKNFADNATLLKLFFGANEEFPVDGWLRMVFWGAVLVVNVCGIVLLKLSNNAWRLYLFLVGWTLFSILPTFQIWHIWPNLVGSRLFFIGSAPLCIMLAVFAVGTAGSARWDRLKVVAGGVGIAVVVACWSVMLQTNLQAWTGAAGRLSSFRSELQTKLADLKSTSEKVFVPTLPQDYKGAPILGRPEYLRTLLRPPFSDRDYTDSVYTAEPIIAGGNEVVGPAVFAAASRRARAVIIEDENDPLLMRVHDKTIAAPVISISPQNPLSLKERWDWLHQSSAARPVLAYDCSSVPGADHARVYISRAWQPFTNALRASPFEKQFVEREIGPAPIRSSALLPAMSPGVHDIAVLAFDKDDKPVGMMSETVSVNARSR